MTTFSEHWYRVAPLHPRLRSHVRIDRHRYRDEIWHVVKDPVSGRHHRLNELGYRVVARMDGRLSMDQIWHLAVAESGDAAPTQPETIALLAQLHEGELIQTEAAPDVAELFNQVERRRGRDMKQRLNPLTIRVALLDPTRGLDALAPLASIVLRRGAIWAWAALILLSLVLLAPRSGEVLAYSAAHVTTPRMLLILWLVYPVIKGLHEMAHGLAVRAWGGEVREMGISLMMLMPVPYVDASSASGFRERHRRVLVSLMGILAETTLAALAALLWLAAADGVLREIAFAVMLTGGVSTVLFNGNPLLRMDAYYALSDAIESPGLAQRSGAYWRYLMRRYLIGVPGALPPAVARGERRWLVGYGLASYIYRVFVAALVIGWLLDVHVMVGAVAALWFLFSMVGGPASKLLSYARTDPELAGHRARAMTWTAVVLAGPLLVFVLIPFPDGTRAPGVVWVPEQAQVRSEGEGFIDQVLVRDGQEVAAGDVMLTLSDPSLDTDMARVLARLDGLDVAYHNVLFSQPAKANDVAQEIARARAELARIETRIAALAVRSPVAGRVALVNERDMPGIYLARGTRVAHVLARDHVGVRVVVSQDDVARLQQRPGPIEVRLADDPGTSLTARLRGQTPAAAHQLPSPALGDRAGGSIVTDATDPEGLRTLEPLFTLDLVLPERMLEQVGGRAWVRFDHGSRPLAQQVWQGLQQLFIGHLPAVTATAPAQREAGA